MKNILVFLLPLLLLTGCVSKQKLQDMTTARDHFKAEYENLKATETENEELKNKLRAAELQSKTYGEMSAQQKNELEILKKYNLELAARYEKAVQESSSLLEAYGQDKSAFEQELAESQDALLRQERQLLGLEQTLGQQSTNLDAVRGDLASREARVAELERLVAEKEAQMSLLRTNLNEALRGFTAADLSVAERNGKIYVSMSQNLLFKTGSDQVDPKGRQALVQLAGVLKNEATIGIIVEGHTDNTGGVDLNWDLSSRRATAVVKILAINAVPAERITAAGRGMHQPIAPNDTEANRAKNRRTEIILSPNLDKLYELSK